jgi:hypothetical protein
MTCIFSNPLSLHYVHYSSVPFTGPRFDRKPTDEKSRYLAPEKGQQHESSEIKKRWNLNIFKGLAYDLRWVENLPILDTVHLSKLDDRFGKISGCPVLFVKFAQSFSKWWFLYMLLGGPEPQASISKGTPAADLVTGIHSVTHRPVASDQQA